MRIRGMGRRDFVYSKAGLQPITQEQTTAPKLAEKFVVSRRTISRDIDALCAAGIPIVTTRGIGGSIRIMDGYRMHGFMREQGYVLDISDKRLHHEIYLSDARKVAPEKLKTVIRHPIRKE